MIIFLCPLSLTFVCFILDVVDMDDRILDSLDLFVDFWFDFIKFGELGAEFDLDFEDFWLELSCLIIKLFELLFREEIEALRFDNVPNCLSLNPFLMPLLSLYNKYNK